MVRFLMMVWVICVTLLPIAVAAMVACIAPAKFAWTPLLWMGACGASCMYQLILQSTTCQLTTKAEISYRNLTSILRFVFGGIFVLGTSVLCMLGANVDVIFIVMLLGGIGWMIAMASILGYDDAVMLIKHQQPRRRNRRTAPTRRMQMM